MVKSQDSHQGTGPPPFRQGIRCRIVKNCSFLRPFRHRSFHSGDNDDGLRQGDVKTHNVGASATIFIDGSEIAIVYQDGATNDMLITRRTGAQWTMGDLLVGPHLYGFHVDAAGNGNRSIVTSYFYDRSIFPSGELSVETIR